MNPTAVPLRLHVQKQLSAVLAQITVENGYRVDVVGVHRGRTSFGAETAMPCISILEAPIPLDQSQRQNLSKGQWELVLQGWVEDDRDNPTDPAHILLADVKQRLAKEARKTDWDLDPQGIFGLGRTVHGMYIGPGVVRPPDEISAKAYFWLTILLDMSEDMAEPYSA